jgi:hypothetical protein
MDELIFPIYRIETRIKYDGCLCDIDFISGSRMYETEPSPESLGKDLSEWLYNLLHEPRKLQDDKRPIIERNPQLFELKINYIEHEAWCSRWFSHYTYVKGRTDDELKQSFHRFIQRKLPLHRQEKYCLMGAEDDWRHKEPCHCKDCQRLGITHITH